MLHLDGPSCVDVTWSGVKFVKTSVLTFITLHDLVFHHFRRAQTLHLVGIWFFSFSPNKVMADVQNYRIYFLFTHKYALHPGWILAKFFICK